MAVHRNSPQAVRRDIGLAVTHRYLVILLHGVILAELSTSR